MKNGGICAPGSGWPLCGIPRRRERRLREVAGAFRGRRHVGDPREPLAQPHPLVVEEEERAVPGERPADRRAELVAVVFGLVLVFGREVIAGGHGAAAEELVGRPREPVRARPRQHVHLAGGVASERGIVGGRHHLELADAVDRRPHGRRVQLRIDVVDPVEDVVVEVLAPAVRAEREVAADRARRALRRRHGARGEQRELEKVAPVERQVGHLVAIDERAHRRRVGLEERRPRFRPTSRHGRGRGHRQFRFEPELLPDRQVGAIAENRESLARGFDRVRPGGQLGKGEVPLGVADAAPRFVGVLPENRDVNARKPGTGLVEDDAANGRARGLGGRFGRGEPEANDRQ